MRPLSTLSIALGALLLAPACYDLPHVDPGPRWIDQFTDDAGVPTWGAFAGWTCGTERLPSTPATSDGGGADAGAADAAPAQAVLADAAVADAGDGGVPRVPCQMGSGFGDSHGLDQPFAFADTSNDVEFAVTAQATSGTVDFTGFRTLTFGAWVRGTAAVPLPPGTVFRVELVCLQNQDKTILAQTVKDIAINAQTWDTFPLELAGFRPPLTSSNGSCLSQIDEIRFVLGPGQNNLRQVVGTLSLDSVGLRN